MKRILGTEDTDRKQQHHATVQELCAAIAMNVQQLRAVS